MKHLKLIAAFILFGLKGFAQDTVKINHAKYATLPTDSIWSLSMKGAYISDLNPYRDQTVKVYGDLVTGQNHKILAEVDTAHNLKVYGDTINVLKAIIRSYGVKVN